MSLETLLGFEAKVPISLSITDWGLARRVAFLMVPEVTCPLSVDGMVWPSLFKTSPGFAENVHGGELDDPGYRGPNAGLWESLSQLNQHLQEHGSEITEEYCVIAVTCVAIPKVLAVADVGPYLCPTTPVVVDPNWRLLGYDVADGSRLSGLMNCGLGGNDDVRGRKAWGSHLNGFHLFNDPRKAVAFASLADRQIPEHAPFFAYSIRLVR